MKITDTSEEIFSAYKDGHFDLDLWGSYMDLCVPGAKDICLSDMRSCIDSGYSWEKDLLPVLESVISSRDKLSEAVSSFRQVTSDLEKKILSRFGRSVDVDIVLYLGLCNGAGWVTEVNGKTSVLLGIEKILELSWCDIDHMNGLILHELGHAYHAQYGKFKEDTSSMPDVFLWKLFTEGVAMVFEQEIAGDASYFHQDKDGWKNWCDTNEKYLFDSFFQDLPSMTYENQRYFGDWVSFEGHTDVGYYLGTKFVRSLMEKASFDEVITYDLDNVRYFYDFFKKNEDEFLKASR